MKAILLSLFSIVAISTNAQTANGIQRLAGTHQLPVANVTAQNSAWENSEASQIPVESNAPYYDTVIKFTEEVDKEELDANAAYFFEKEFGSKSIFIETKRHHYKGDGMYLFCADKKIGAAGIYKVFYTIDVKVKGSKCYVTMSDFRLENQHAQVSFQYLVKNAKLNDIKSIGILSQFHRNNQGEMGRFMTSMASKDHSDYATAYVK